MRISRITPIALLSALALAACDNGAKQQLATISHVDSLRVDSLGNVRKDLLEEVMTSTQFVNEINTELAKARALAARSRRRSSKRTRRCTQVNEERKRVVARITHLVAQARLGPDASRHRRASRRSRCRKKDSALVAQVADV